MIGVCGVSDKLRVLSLFSGIGAFEKALTNQGIDYELVGFSEIDKYAIKSYCAIHNENIEKSLGDITKIDISKLPEDIDLLTHGSPCTSFSLAGKQAGGDEGSGTPSSLLWYSVEIIRQKKPKIVMWENVPNVLSSKHKHNFERYLSVLEDLGYQNTYVVLNGKDFGVAQNRKRLICISVLNGVNAVSEYSLCSLPEMGLHIKFRDSRVIRDILEDTYPDNTLLTRPVRPYNSNRKSDCICIGQSSNNGSQGGKVYSIDGVFPTICAGTHGYALGYIQDAKDVYRKITPLEAFRLMGFSDEDYEKAKAVKMSETQLYKQAGNSIVVPMLEEIYRVLFNLE